MAQTQRVVILSDTHLADTGRGAGSPAALRPLWRGASRVIFNGDTAETGEPARRAVSEQAIAELQALCEEDGVRMTLIAGNHDPYVTDLHWLELRGGEVFLTHGDALHFAIAPWTVSTRRIRRLHAEVHEEIEGDVNNHMERRLAAAKQASAREWWQEHWHESQESPALTLMGKGIMATKALWYWRTEPQRAMRFAEQFAPQSRFFIFGHLHRPGVWRDPDARAGQGRIIINTGAYRMPRRPRAVVIQGQTLEVYPVRYNLPQGHRLAAIPKAKFTLTQPPDDGDGARYPF